MLRGQSQSGSQFGSRALGRCKSNTEDPVIVDLDVIIIDVPETSEQGSRRSRKRSSKQSFPSDPITIIDEDKDIIVTPRNSHGKASYPTSSNFISTEGSDSDDCLMIISERNFASKSAAKKRVYCKNKCTQNRFGLYSSESDSSDCEIVEDSSGNVRERWEKASLRKRTSVEDQVRSENQDTAVGSHADPISSSPKATDDKDEAEIFSNKVLSNNCEDVHVDKSSSHSTNGKENATSSIPVLEIITEKAPVESNAFQSTASTLSSPKTVHDKVGAGSCTNTMYSNCCRGVSVDNSSTGSSTRKEHMSSNIPSSDNLKEKLPPEANTNHLLSRVPTDQRIEESPPKTEVNTCIADSSTCDVRGEPRLQNEGMTSEKYSSGVKSTDETLFDNKSVAFTDEVPLWVPSSCNSRLRHKKLYVASFHEKHHNHIPGEPSCDTESWYKVDVEHEVFGFQGKEKSVSEPSVARSHVPTGHVCNAEFNRFNCSAEATLREPISNHHEGSGTVVEDHYKESDHLVDMLREDLMGERERHKESDEYKRAAEEEWAARIQQLQIQAEEAHQLRRKRKAEKQVLDMEKRQKQRLEEIRESQRQGEETLSLKEKLRSEVRKELDQMELRYRDMASLLRALGIHVEGGANPLSREVSAAYKKAVLKFHPDRSSRLEIRQQVEAEEKFKLISRLKEKLLL